VGLGGTVAVWHEDDPVKVVMHDRPLKTWQPIPTAAAQQIGQEAWLMFSSG
jgi:hypothetical protein